MSTVPDPRLLTRCINLVSREVAVATDVTLDMALAASLEATPQNILASIEALDMEPYAVVTAAMTAVIAAEIASRGR